MAADAAALLEQLSVASPTTIETLPDELHPLILQFLNVSGLVAAAGVCQAWMRHAEVVAKQKLRRAGWSNPSIGLYDASPPSWLRACHIAFNVNQKFHSDRRQEFWRETGVAGEWRFLRIEQVMRMAQGDPARLQFLRAQIRRHMTPEVFRTGRMSFDEMRGRLEPQVLWMMEHGWKTEPAIVVSMASYGGSYAVAAAFRNEFAMGSFALSVIPRQVLLPSLLGDTCMFVWRAFSVYAYSAEEQADIPDEPDIPEAQLHIPEARVYPAPDAFAALTGEFSLGDEDPAWLKLQQAAPGFVFDSRCISVCMAANDLNFDYNFHGGFRTPVRVDGVVQYRLRDSPIVRLVSAPRDRSGCHSLIPVDHDTFRVPPLARIKLERIDEPGEWSVNDHAIWQRCYTVSLSYG